MVKIGTITLGQSPRIDLVPELSARLGPGYEVVECGALDGYVLESIPAPQAGDAVLVSRLRDGSEAVFTPEFIGPLLQGCVDKLQSQGAAGIILLCTGSLPPLRADVPLLEPARLLTGVLGAIAGRCGVDLMVPHPEQLAGQRRRLDTLGFPGEGVSASPYGDPAALETAAAALRQSSSRLLLLDCMGYSQDMAAAAAAGSGKKVLLPRSLLAACAAELF